MTTSTTPRIPFRGPYANGPPAAALEVHAPPLTGLHWRDITRFIVVLVVLAKSVLRSVTIGQIRHRRPLAEAACDGLVDGFITLGPTFVKVGQIMASSTALIPPVLGVASRRCLDAVPPFPTADVHRVIEEDLGRSVGEVFAAFDDIALSAASIGQVHACTLDYGRRAVVKVQRPDITETMGVDLRIGHRLARWFDRTPWGRHAQAQRLIEELHQTTFQELNPALEADRQHRFLANIGAFGDNSQMTAPEIYWDHCGPRIICMERVDGIPMDHFDELEARGFDGQAMLRGGAKVWAEGVMIHGPFHGDLHAGNLWALEDGRGCFLDFGIVGELDDDWKQVLKDLFYSCMFDRDFTRIARAFRRVGAIPADIGTDEELGAMLGMFLGDVLDDGFGNLDMAAVVAQALEIAKTYNGVLPPEMALISKQLLYIDRYTKRLAPSYSLTSDPYVVKNIFPTEARAKAAELGIDLNALT